MKSSSSAEQFIYTRAEILYLRVRLTLLVSNLARGAKVDVHNEQIKIPSLLALSEKHFRR